MMWSEYAPKGSGLDLVTSAGVERDDILCFADNDVYEWSTRTIYLRHETAIGTDWHSRLCAAHELMHWRQHREKPWLMWLLWIKPVRWWLEMDAWQRAVEMLRNYS